MQKKYQLILWAAIQSYMDKNGHNMQSIKSKNPFPVGTRWISTFKAAANDEKDNTSFNKGKTMLMLEFLKLPYVVDGGSIVLKTTK